MKKIILYTVSIVMVLLVVTTIILAIVPSAFYNGITNDPFSMTIYYKGESKEGICKTLPFGDDESSKSVRAKNAEIIDNINKYHLESLTENVLFSLFSGAYSYKASIDTINTTINLNDSSKVYVEFNYNQYKNLQLNGKDYTERNEEEINVVKYNRLALEVLNSKELTNVKIYVLNYELGNDTPSCKYCINTIAQQSALYNYISELFA